MYAIELQPRLYRYELSYFTGYTFMMQFMAMRARTWREILGRRDMVARWL